MIKTIEENKNRTRTLQDTLPIPTLSQQQKERFWSNVATGNDDDCWEWNRFCMPTGYGKVGFMCSGVSKNYYTHRIAYTLVKGEIPSGFVIDHLCFNTSCCNPSHLEAVPARVNTLRGRSAYVACHHANTCINGHELVDDNVYIIHESRKGGQPVRRCKTCRQQATLASQRRRNSSKKQEREQRIRDIRAAEGNSVDIAKQFGVHPATVDRIKSGKSWVNVS